MMRLIILQLALYIAIINCSTVVGMQDSNNIPEEEKKVLQTSPRDLTLFCINDIYVQELHLGKIISCLKNLEEYNQPLLQELLSKAIVQSVRPMTYTLSTFLKTKLSSIKIYRKILSKNQDKRNSPYLKRRLKDKICDIKETFLFTENTITKEFSILITGLISVQSNNSYIPTLNKVQELTTASIVSRNQIKQGKLYLG